MNSTVCTKNPYHIRLSIQEIVPALTFCNKSPIFCFFRKMKYKLLGTKSPFLWHLSRKTYEFLHKKLFSKDKYLFIKGPPSLLDELIP